MVRPVDVVNRIGEGTQRRFTSKLHETRIAAVLGIALGVSFSVCFVTGLLSHLIQHPPSWFAWPPRPAGLYRITQGLHVTTGFMAIPLLLAKLWVVSPRLWTWPPVRNVAHAVERISLVPLVGGSVFMLFSGLANVARWYPYGFYFPSAHFAIAWVTIGGLVAHIAAKVTSTRDALRRSPPPGLVTASGVDRRVFLGGVAATTGLVALATSGGTIAPLSGISALAQRVPTAGPQGLPVNKSAAAARVRDIATGDDYRLVVDGAVTNPLSLSLEELRALPQSSAVLPITCVEGWSRGASWSGVAVRDLLAMAGAHEGASVRVESIERGSRYRTSDLNVAVAHDRDTLLALDINGAPLHLDHGFPVRLIAPNRPGVMQTKWVIKVVVR
ncbi:MAG: molybdopterin-dependent oxidoreductase [Ilumatobacteraceae bacterium]